MRALSLWQPWAGAVSVGIKRVETRSWSTPYRGPIAIHAAKRWSAEQARAALRLAEDCVTFRSALQLSDLGEPFKAALRRGSITHPAHPWSCMCGCQESDMGSLVRADAWPRGCVVAVAELTACVPADGIDVADREGRWGDFTPGRFGWVLSAVQPLVRPYPLVGRQGLWTLSQEERDAVLALARGSKPMVDHNGSSFGSDP